MLASLSAVSKAMSKPLGDVSVSPCDGAMPKKPFAQLSED